MVVKFLGTQKHAAKTWETMLGLGLLSQNTRRQQGQDAKGKLLRIIWFRSQTSLLALTPTGVSWVGLGGTTAPLSTTSTCTAFVVQWMQQTIKHQRPTSLRVCGAITR